MNFSSEQILVFCSQKHKKYKKKNQFKGHPFNKDTTNYSENDHVVEYV